jgi:sugar diacid utilization regulator
VTKPSASPPKAAAAGFDATETMLYSAASELLKEHATSEVLDTAVRHAHRLLATDISFVLVLDPATNMMRSQASVGHVTAAFATLTRPVEALTVMGTGKPLQSSDFLNDSRFDHDPPTDELLRNEGMRTVLAVPLRTSERKLGALYVGHRSERIFTPHEVDSLVRLSEHVAAAFVQAQTLAQLKLERDQSLQRAAEAERRATMIGQADDIRRDISSGLQEHGGVSTAAVLLAEQLKRRVMVTDWKLAVMVMAHGGPSASALKSPAALLNRREFRAAAAESTQTHRPVRANSDWAVAPIEAARNLLGYLWVELTRNPDEDELVHLVMERIVPVTAVEMISEGDTERRLHGDFIYELLSERLPDFSVLEARVARAWSRHGSRHRPVILKASTGDDQWSSHVEAARRLVAAARPNDFVAVYGQHLILLITAIDRPQVEEALADILTLLDRNHLRADVAVGGVCRDLRESRETILATLRLQDLIASTSPLWAEGLEALTQLFDPNHRDRLESFCRTAVAPLRGRQTLMDALHAYYESGGNKANAARRLSIHVNTLRQRLDRAHELLGGSIDDSIRAVPLRLALLVREVLPRR